MVQGSWPVSPQSSRTPAATALATSNWMDVDGDVHPLMERMQNTVKPIQQTILAQLKNLEEDVVVSNYSTDEQARLSLAAAFALSLSYYSYLKLKNEHVDDQLLLKISRIKDYIKKLKEISLLSTGEASGVAASDQPPRRKGKRPRTGNDEVGSPQNVQQPEVAANNVSSECPEASQEAKVPKRETQAPKATGVGRQLSAPQGSLSGAKPTVEDPFGDSLMFAAVERPNSGVGELAMKLVKQL